MIIKYIVWGMALQAFVVAFLIELGSLKVTSNQQLLAGIIFAAVALIIHLITKKKPIVTGSLAD